MLLQRLSEYADTIGLPPPMYQNKPVRYIILLDKEGGNPRIIDSATQENKRGKEMPVPDCTRSSGDRPMLLADHAEYTLGMPRKDKSIESALRRHGMYVELVRDCAIETREPAVEAVMRFLEALEPGKAGFPLPDDFDPTVRITFEVFFGLDRVRPIDLPSVRAYWAGKVAPGDVTQPMQCLVCGEVRPPVGRLPIKIGGIPGGQQSGMALISANAAAFESYGLEASRIAPTCEECGQRFGTALNHLLRQPETHLNVSSVAYVFWTREPTTFQFSTMLSQADQTEVRHFLTSLWRGKEAYLDATPFYAAAFSASNARIVVRDWIETTLGQVQDHLEHYFRLQRMVDRAGEPRWFPLWQLVAATVSQKSKEKPAPQVEQALLHLALCGGPLPQWLLYQIVRRVRSDRDIQAAQAAIIKMVLLSQEDKSWLGHPTPSDQASIDIERGDDMTELDLSCSDKAYLCGRLLAVLEAVQYQALGQVNSNIVDRYYGTASSAPASVFGRLLRGAQPHMATLSRDKRGAFLRLDEQLQEILARFEDKKFPATLDLMAQGRFALGYYQQKAANRRAARLAGEKKAAQQQGDTFPSEEDENYENTPEAEAMFAGADDDENAPDGG